MDVLLQRHCAKHIYVVPEGLRELMSDISREVLRSQPTELYTFIADYLDALMITRENARVAARTLASLEETSIITANLLIHHNLTKEDGDKAAAIIQAAFRDYMGKMFPTNEAEIAEKEKELIDTLVVQLDVPLEALEAASVIIQRAFREFRLRKQNERKLLTGMIDWRVAARSTIALYRKAGVTEEEAHRAATLIKAAYKGYYTRRLMKRLLEEGAKMYAEEEEEETEEFEAETRTGQLQEQPGEQMELYGEGNFANWEEYYAQSYGIDKQTLRAIFTREQILELPRYMHAIVVMQRAYRNHLRRTGRGHMVAFGPPYEVPELSLADMDYEDSVSTASKRTRTSTLVAPRPSMVSGARPSTAKSTTAEDEERQFVFAEAAAVMDDVIAAVIPDLELFGEGGLGIGDFGAEPTLLSDITEGVEPLSNVGDGTLEMTTANEENVGNDDMREQQVQEDAVGEQQVQEDTEVTNAEPDSIPAETPRDNASVTGDVTDTTVTDTDATDMEFTTSPDMTTDDEL